MTTCQDNLNRQQENTTYSKQVQSTVQRQVLHPNRPGTEPSRPPIQESHSYSMLNTRPPCDGGGPLYLISKTSFTTPVIVLILGQSMVARSVALRTFASSQFGSLHPKTSTNSSRRFLSSHSFPPYGLLCRLCHLFSCSEESSQGRSLNSFSFNMYHGRERTRIHHYLHVVVLLKRWCYCPPFG